MGIKDRRLEKGLTLQQVADDIGCTDAAIVNYENGRIPKFEIAKKLAEEYGCSWVDIYNDYEMALTEEQPEAEKG